MLPFLRKQQEGAASSPVESVKRESDHEEEFDSLEVAAEEILFAIEKKDAKALAQAFKAACDIVDAEPHVEGEHI